MLLDCNNTLLTESEKVVLERFRIHTKGLIAHHLNGANDIKYTISCRYEHHIM